MFFWDTGIRNAILNEFSLSSVRPDIGILWENWVVAECAKYNALGGNLATLYFWRSRDGSEVDLVVKRGSTIRAFEIKWSNRRARGRAFTNRYGVSVELITKEDAADLPRIFGFETRDSASQT